MNSISEKLIINLAWYLDPKISVPVVRADTNTELTVPCCYVAVDSAAAVENLPNHFEIDGRCVIITDMTDDGSNMDQDNLSGELEQALVSCDLLPALNPPDFGTDPRPRTGIKVHFFRLDGSETEIDGRQIKSSVIFKAFVFRS